MEHPHHRSDSRTASADVEVGYGWRESLSRLHKNPVVRKHVRYWLLGLMSFGPIR